MPIATRLGAGGRLVYHHDKEVPAMPLREHFRRPLPPGNRWDALHGGWPMIMATELNKKLPGRYAAQPRIHVGSAFEIDAGAYERFQADRPTADATEGGVAVATAIEAPPQPTLTVATDFPDQD